MSLETHIAGSEDRLIDGLHFAGRNTASYIVNRRDATFHPSSASNFKPSGVRLMRWNLADQAGWLDGNSVRLIFTLNNLMTAPTQGQAPATGALRPKSDTPAGMFRRLRILAGGSEIENIEDYGRVHQMFSTLLPSNVRMNNVAEGWAGEAVPVSLSHPADDVSSIFAQESRTLCVQLLSPFLSQGKYIPMSMMPLTLELELDDLGAALTQAVGAMNWEITRPRLLASVVDLDGTLANSYAKHLLDGKSLPIYTRNLYSVKSSISSTQTFSFPITRGFTRLSGVYVTLWDGAGGGMWVDRFYHPLAGDRNHAARDGLTWNMTIGSERWPSFDCDSLQESFYRLRLMASNHLGNTEFGFAASTYGENHFVLGQTFEKAAGQSSHTGINTRSGSMLTLNFKNLGNAQMVHVVLVYDQVVNLSAAGVEVLD